MRIIFLSVIIPVFVLAQGWPLSPQNQVHPVGNNWGEYQEYGSGPYLHNGVDVMGVTTGQPVYAVGRGTVKAWLTIQADYHWRLAIGDSHRIPTDSCDGWLYAHIDRNRFHLNVGDTCRPGDLIGYLVVWPTTGFDHCHWARIRNAGYPWQSNWLFVQNPLWVVRPNIDSFPPIFENARGSERFAFCRNNTSTYLASNNLNGDVDIIIKVLDKTCRPWRDTVWTRLIPYKIEYRMRGPVNIPTTRFMEFRGKLLWDAAATNTIYKDDGTCNTRGDYSYRDYFFIITNTDGDTLIEPTDTAGKWQTQNYPDGNYWVVVTAYDAYGNARAESMLVTLRNGNKVEGNTLDGLTGHFSITPTVVPSQKAVKINRSKEIVKPCRLNIFDVTGKKVF
ncbi:MAG: M23 family metallopeptidase, partial [candidate division WOR-3 bacterium]